MRYGVALKDVCETCGQPLPGAGGLELRVGRITLNPVRATATVDGRDLGLTPTERRILTLLVVNAGDLCTYADLYEAAWNEQIDPDLLIARRQKHAVRVHLARLKGRLGPIARDYLKTTNGPAEEGGITLVPPV